MERVDIMATEENYDERLKHVETKVDQIDRKVDGIITESSVEKEKNNQMFSIMQSMIDRLNDTQIEISKDMKDIKDIMLEFMQTTTENKKDVQTLKEQHNEEIEKLKNKNKHVHERFNKMEAEQAEVQQEKWKFFGLVVGAIVTIVTSIFKLL